MEASLRQLGLPDIKLTVPWLELITRALVGPTTRRWLKATEQRLSVSPREVIKWSRSSASAIGLAAASGSGSTNLTAVSAIRQTELAWSGSGAV
jgi:hypothetical protein